MTRGRLEAFSDAVIAIVMTIMVLELVPPPGATVDDLLSIGPHLVPYVLSFVILAIYWVNHHHLLQAARTISGRVLWANMLLLFTLSLIPFGTAWIGETEFAALPMSVYGVILLASALAYFLLVRALLAAPGQTGTLAAALGRDVKGRISPLIYALAIPTSFLAPPVAFGLYVLVALIWFVPDRRIERRMAA